MSFPGHVQVGFDLKRLKNYATPEAAVKGVELAAKDLLAAGLMFNIVVTSQRRGGMGTDAEDTRYIPLLNCFRCGSKAGAVNQVQAMVALARKGFTCFM